MIFELWKKRVDALDLKARMLDEKYLSILADRAVTADMAHDALASVNAAMDAVNRESRSLGSHMPLRMTREQSRWLSARNNACAADEARFNTRIRRILAQRGWAVGSSVGASRHAASASKPAPVDLGLQETARAMHVRVRTLARVQGQTGKSTAELKASMRAALKHAHGVSPDQAFSDYWAKK
ncbi:hypothetical protein [Bifidobacterium aquikefiri]|uniref:hypothetical protein n=1 Tax=Bifidobacterium aquikefiri TaxID=1653207 RepID=UPI0039EAF9F5